MIGFELCVSGIRLIDGADSNRRTVKGIGSAIQCLLGSHEERQERTQVIAQGNDIALKRHERRQASKEKGLIGKKLQSFRESFSACFYFAQCWLCKIEQFINDHMVIVCLFVVCLSKN
jgi:hypothetical protein